MPPETVPKPPAGGSATASWQLWCVVAGRTCHDVTQLPGRGETARTEGSTDLPERGERPGTEGRSEASQRANRPGLRAAPGVVHRPDRPADALSAHNGPSAHGSDAAYRLALPAGTVTPVLLSDRDIRAEVAADRIRLDPWDAAMVQPSSVDVRLDRYFRLFDNHRYPHIDPAAEQPDLTRLVEVGSESPVPGGAGETTFVLHPGEFVLGSTLESVTLPDDLAARVEGKSSLGRLGLLTHATAGFVDPGFSGHVTLELSNVATLPIVLYPGMKIGQLCFFRLTSAAENPYGTGASGSHYQGQRGPTASRSWQNFHRSGL